MNKARLKSVTVIDKLLYVFLVIAFFITAVTAVTSAKFTSRVNSYVISNVSNVQIDFADGGDGTIVLADWKPGDTRTIEFSLRNYNDDNEVNELALIYQLQIETSSLLPLTYTLTKTTDTGSAQLALSVAKEEVTTFDIYSTTDNTLKHSIPQLDSFVLEISWPVENNDAEALEAGGEYIRIILNWRQYVAQV